MSATFSVREDLPVLTVFCVDVSQEMDSDVNTTGTTLNAKISRLNSIRALIPRFARARNLMNPNHQTAVLTFGSRMAWVSDFTSDAAALERKLSDVNCASSAEVDDLDVVYLLDTVSQKLIARKAVDGDQYAYQVVLIYGRSTSLPILDKQNPALEAIYNGPNGRGIFVDLIYIHEKVNETIQQAFDILLLLEGNGRPTYIFEFSRSVKKLQAAFAELLPVPTQRPIQEEQGYKTVLKSLVQFASPAASTSSSGTLGRTSAAK